MFRIASIIVFAFASTTFADTKPKPDRNAVKLEGTKWEGVDSLGKTWKFTFVQGGALECVLDQHPCQKATWNNENHKLYLETNNRYAEFEGKVEKEEIRLEAHNVKGLQWTVTLKPFKEAPGKP